MLTFSYRYAQLFWLSSVNQHSLHCKFLRHPDTGRQRNTRQHVCHGSTEPGFVLYDCLTVCYVGQNPCPADVIHLCRGTKLCFHCQAYSLGPFGSWCTCHQILFVRFFISRRIRFSLPVAQRVNYCCDCAQPFLRCSGAFLTVTFIVQANIQAGRIPKQPNITVFPFSINELEFSSDKKGNIRR